MTMRVAGYSFLALLVLVLAPPDLHFAVVGEALDRAPRRDPAAQEVGLIVRDAAGLQRVGVRLDLLPNPRQQDARLDAAGVEPNPAHDT